MLKKDYINAINDLGIKDVQIDEDTKITVPVLELVLEGGKSDGLKADLAKEQKLRAEAEQTSEKLKNQLQESEHLVKELNEELEEKSGEIEQLKTGNKVVTLPVVTYKREKYQFTLAAFKYPKMGVLKAEEAAVMEHLFPEFVKRGILIKKEG